MKIDPRDGLIVCLTGLALIAAITVLATILWKEAKDVSSVVAACGGVIGTIVGAFFGLQVGTSDAADAKKERDKAKTKAQALMGMLTDAESKTLRDSYGPSFAPSDRAESQPRTDTDRGLAVCLVGMLLLAVIAGCAMMRWTDATDVTSVVGACGGVIGTIVGAFFGLKIGGTGTSEAKKERDKAEDQVQLLMSAISPQAFQELMRAQPTLFAPAVR